MRKVVFFGCVVGVLVFSALRVAAVGVHEDFEGYSGGNTLNWLFTTDTALQYVNGDGDPQPTWYATGLADPGDGTQAGYFIVSNTGLDGGPNYADGDHVYFESNSSSVLNASVDPARFSAALAFALNDGYSSSTDLAATSVDYYFYTDADGDNSIDHYYQASVGSLPSNPSTLQTYPAVGMLGSSDTWDVYSFNGSGWTYGGSTTLTSAITDDMVGVGIDMGLSGSLAGSDTMTIWVDDVNAVVPEPSALMLACFGALGFFVRRRRRQG